MDCFVVNTAGAHIWSDGRNVLVARVGVGSVDFWIFQTVGRPVAVDLASLG